jgi:hypothetical protein
MSEFNDGRIAAIFAAVMAELPTAPLWAELFRAQPGLSMRPADTDGFVSITHGGDVVFDVEVRAFTDPQIDGAVVRVMVDGEQRELELHAYPETVE